MDIVIISEFSESFSKTDNDRFLYLARMLSEEHEVEIVTTRDIGYCDVCSARVVAKRSEGEMRAEFFVTIPEELAFDRSEYETVIPWARGTL